jgi:RNA polymerase sigma-70 factor (ECF subfamily)
MSADSTARIREKPLGSGGVDSDAASAALERAGRGDRSAIMWLYDQYAPMLTAVALRITGSTAEAEEVVQDAMVRAWLEAGTFDRTRGSAGAWLVTLTRNRAIDVVRARGRRAHHEADAGDESELGATPLTPERAMVESERATAVRSALAVLTEDQRRTLDLAYFSGLSHSEIAEQLGQPLGTVKTRIAQAVRRLREELARFGQ